MPFCILACPTAYHFADTPLFAGGRPDGSPQVQQRFWQGHWQQLLASHASLATCLAPCTALASLSCTTPYTPFVSLDRHPNVVGFLGVCPTPPCVVTEYCSRGSLSDVFRAARQQPEVAVRLDWHRRLRMVKADCHRLVINLPLFYAVVLVGLRSGGWVVMQGLAMDRSGLNCQLQITAVHCIFPDLRSCWTLRVECIICTGIWKNYYYNCRAQA